VINNCNKLGPYLIHHHGYIWKIISMERQPIPLRKVPLIAKWSPEDLARLLTREFEELSYILTAYEWVEDRAARTISPSTMQAALAGLDTAPDTHSKIALIPANYFVWSDELEDAYQTYHYYVSLQAEDEDELDPHGVFDMDPATHPYNDLLSECPRFASNLYLTGGAPPTRQELNKQKTRERNARWQARAKGLKKENPKRVDEQIAKLISKEEIAEGSTYNTILRNISTHKT
jgi:hypothetical protein